MEPTPLDLSTDMPTGYEITPVRPEDEVPRTPSLATITSVEWIEPHTIRMYMSDGTHQDSTGEYDNYIDVRNSVQKVVDN